VFGYLAEGGNWEAPFIVAAGLLVVGAAVWAFWLDPDKNILTSGYASHDRAAEALR
jgi:hypothetical protein